MSRGNYGSVIAVVIIWFADNIIRLLTLLLHSKKSKRKAGKVSF